MYGDLKVACPHCGAVAHWSAQWDRWHCEACDGRDTGMSLIPEAGARMACGDVICERAHDILRRGGVLGRYHRV